MKRLIWPPQATTPARPPQATTPARPPQANHTVSRPATAGHTRPATAGPLGHRRPQSPSSSRPPACSGIRRALSSWLSALAGVCPWHSCWASLLVASCFLVWLACAFVVAFSARWRLPMALALGKSACRLVFLSLVGVRFLRRGFQRSLASAPGTRVGQVCLSPCVSYPVELSL